MTLDLNRRRFLIGAIAAPVVIRTAGILMPVKALPAPIVSRAIARVPDQIARHTVAIVTWNDPDDAYQARCEAVYDVEAMDRLGYLPIHIDGFGVTSREQANRLAQSQLRFGVIESVGFGPLDVMEQSA